MGFNPGRQVRCGDVVVVPGAEVAGIEVLRVQGATQRAAVCGCGDAAAALVGVGEQLRIVGVAGDAVVQHLAILVLRAVGKDLGPVRGVVVLPRQLDMLGGIIAEAVHAIIDQLLEVGGHHVADGGIAVGVDIVQADQLAVGDLVTVVPVGNVAVIAVVMVIIVVLPAGGDGVVIGGHVVGHDVHDDTHAVLVRGLAQALQVGF